MTSTRSRSPAYHEYRAFTRRQRHFFSAAQDSINRRVQDLKRRLMSGKTKKPRSQTLDKLRDVITTSGEWLIVMMVSSMESYLVDVLSWAASKDPELMAKSEQAARYEEVLSAADLESLAEHLRRRWAGNFVDDGGPRRWIDRLQRMGAKGYQEETTPVLEELRGIRHAVIHNAGVASAEFLKRHPSLEIEAGDRILAKKPLKRREGMRLRAPFTHNTHLPPYHPPIPPT